MFSYLINIIKPNMKMQEALPLFYTFEPTIECNLKCHMCYEKDIRQTSRQTEEMSLGQIKQAFNTLELDDLKCISNNISIASVLYPSKSGIVTARSPRGFQSERIFITF